ncbi:MAG TPA: peptidyl-prolyl cis-trans isomerase [Terriglobales bacterium]|nr:peptidyl-prolyl cis-trans isomerase [Terriglobales bacterium]
MIRFLQTPGKAKKIVLGGLLVIICGAMVITLVPGGILGDAFGFSAVPKGVLAKVGDREIGMQEVEQQARQVARRNFQGNVPAGLMPFLRQRAAESLIQQKALLSLADRMGLRATDADLQDELQHGSFAPYFFPNGNFIGADAYESFVNQRINMSVPQFEQAMKDDLTLHKLMAAVQGPIVVSPQEVEAEARQQNTKVKILYAVISPDELMKQIKATETELKAFYEQNKARYVNSIPEKRQVRYVVIDPSKLESQVQVTPQDLQRYYHDHEGEFRVPEQILLRQIVVRVPLAGPDGKVDPKAVQEARAKAEDIAKKLQGGANFADLAKKYSDDGESAKEGGLVGWVARGRLPEIENQAFSLAKGQSSGVVQSSIGFHILHVDDKQQAHLKTPEEVKSQIEPIIRRDKAQRLAENVANAIESQGHSGDLEKAAKAKGQEVLTSAFVTRNDTLPGIGTAPEVMSAIFSSPAKAPPEVAHTPQSNVIYQVTEIKPPATPSFEDIKTRVEQDFKSERANAMLGQRTQEVADRAKADHDLKKAAQQLGAELRTSELVTESSQVPEIGVMSGPASVVFTMKPGEISGPLNTGRNGVVLSVLEKQEASGEELAKASAQVRESLLQRKREEAMGLFVSDLRQRMEKEGKIKINKQEWERITQGARSEPGS